MGGGGVGVVLQPKCDSNSDTGESWGICSRPAGGGGPVYVTRDVTTGRSTYTVALYILLYYVQQLLCTCLHVWTLWLAVFILITWLAGFPSSDQVIGWIWHANIFILSSGVRLNSFRSCHLIDWYFPVLTWGGDCLNFFFHFFLADIFSISPGDWLNYFSSHHMIGWQFPHLS
jgi:hypothetical protein